MESFAWNTCYVCHDSTVQTSDNVSQLRSMYSQLTLPVLLKMILGEELTVGWTTSDTMCFGCIAKVNDYDEAIQKAQAIQNDLVMVYRERRVDVKMECDDPISIEANSLDATDYHIDEVEGKFGCSQSSVFDSAQDEEYSMQSSFTQSYLGSGEMARPVPSANRNANTMAQHLREEQVNGTDRLDVSCEICFERFSTSRYLRAHMQLRHDRAKANGPPYRCEFCGLEYYTEHDYAVHIERHRAAHKYQCFLCPFVGKIPRLLKQHMQTHTRQNKCGICGRGCIDTQSLAQHMKLHNNETYYECYICKFTISSKDTIAKHMREKHVMTTIRSDCICEICSETFSAPRYLRRHMLKHDRAKANGPPYNCEFCGLEYYTEHDYDDHIELHRAAPKYQCFHCSYVTQITKTLKQHMNIHTKMNKCHVCGRGCIDAQSLEKHTKLHGDEINDKRSTTASFKRTKPIAPRPTLSLSCDICHRKFTVQFKLEAHMKKHNTAKDNGPPYHCESCGLEFYTENEFDLHLEHHRNVPNYQCLHCVFIGRNGERYRSHMNAHTKHYKCKLCCRGCIDSFALERHLATHLDFECSICEFQTKSIEEFQDHLRDEHAKLDPSLRATDCVVCKKCFESDQALQTHLTLVHTKHESPPTQCTQCGIRLKDTDALVNHKIRHLNRAQYQCVLCDRVFSTHSSLEVHMRKHTKEKSYRCECGSRFAFQPSLSRHMNRWKHLSSTVQEREVFDEATYIAQQSRKGSSSVTPSINTSTNSNRPKCTNCWATFGSSDALEEHTQLAKCPKRKFICKVCHQAFTARYNYLKHLKIHNLSASDTEPPFICDYCNIELQTYEDLRAHKSLHVNRPDIECVMCEYKASNQSGLKSHMQRAHVKQEPVQCDTCGKVFNSKQLLWYHSKQHKDFLNECYLCKWRAISKGALRLHMRKHTGDKPYKCKHCDKRFARRANRCAHYLVHRGLTGRSYKCTICGVVFPRARQRSEHYLQTHGLAADPPKHQQIEIKK